MLYTIGLVAYILAMLAVAFWVKDRVKSTEDFLVAGRKLNTMYSFFALMPCYLGGFVLIGTAGTSFTDGFWSSESQWGILTDSGGAFVCMALCFMFYMPKIWKLRLISLGDLYYDRYGRICGIIASIFLTGGFMFWVATQVLVFAKLIAPILGWDPNFALVVALVVICLYTIMGGLWAVATTDIFQVSLVLAGILVLFPVALDAVGGWENFRAHVPIEITHILPQDGNPTGKWIPWVAGWLIVGIGGVATPDLMQRAFAAKSVSVIRRSSCLAMVALFIATLLVYYIAQMGRVMFDQGLLPTELLMDDPELILPVMFKHILPAPLVCLFLGAGLAAVMSAAASSILAVSGLFAKNIYKDIFVPNASDKSIILVTRILILVVAFGGYGIAVAFPYAQNMSVFVFDLLLACMFVPMTLALCWKKANGYGALAGMIAGFGFRVIGGSMAMGFSWEGILSPLDNWWWFTLLSPSLCLVVMVAVSLLTQKINPPVPLKEYDDNGEPKLKKGEWLNPVIT